MWGEGGESPYFIIKVVSYPNIFCKKNLNNLKEEYKLVNGNETCSVFSVQRLDHEKVIHYTLFKISNLVLGNEA